MLLATLCLFGCLTPPSETSSGLQASEGSDTATPEDQDDPGAADGTDDGTELHDDSGEDQPVVTGDCSGGGSAGFCTGRGEARGAGNGVFPALFRADFDGFTEVCGVTSDAAWLACSLTTADDCETPVEALPLALSGNLFVCGHAEDPDGPTVGTCTIETGAGPLAFVITLD